MKSMAIVRMAIFGLSVAVLLSLISLFSLNKIMDYGASNHRRYFMLSLAGFIEERPLDSNVLEIARGIKFKSPFSFGGPPPKGPFGFRPAPPDSFGPPMPLPGGSGGPPPSQTPPPPPPRMNMWVVSEEGEVIAASPESKALPNLSDVPRPKEIHDITSNERFFRLQTCTFMIKLDTKPGAYLVVNEGNRPFFTGPIFAIQSLLTFTTVSLAIFISLFITFLYLRRKSRAAKGIFLRLEKGDLNARFDIKRVDEFAGLMVDFNRMANEIERLVLRIHETEKSRKNLLQELGHDLRTPLTGLTTAYETLKDHFQKITEKDREELFGIMGGEINYIKELIEKLLTIATIDEPHYKKSTEEIDIEDILGQELKARQNGNLGTDALQWRFESKLPQGSGNTLLGDPHLVMRLLRNGLDNASKFAKKEVIVKLHEKDQNFEIQINDDGPGLTPAELESFGKRRDYRARVVSGLHYSIGLGSVIMKTIAELHGGHVDIHNLTTETNIKGASLKITLPKSV